MCPSGQFGLEAITRLEEEQNLLTGGTGGMRPPILEQILIFTYYVYTYRIWIWIQKGLFKREGAGGVCSSELCPGTQWYSESRAIKNKDYQELSQTECTLTCSIQSCGSCLQAFQAAVTWDTAPLFFLSPPAPPTPLRGYWLTTIIAAEVLVADIKMTSCDFLLPERSWHFNKV